MSEYQCYEFVALDRALSAKQMAELRAISTRAQISSTRFWNEYHWGDLKADPAKLVLRYFDAHLYFANWGTHRLILRLPKARVDANALKPYFVGGKAARIKSAGAHVMLDLHADSEEPEYDDESAGSLVVLVQLRAELMRGDLRPAYLAWLLAVQADDLDDGALEPPVPAGLTKLSAAQRTMVDFLRIDVDLVSAADGARSQASGARERRVLRRTVGELRALAEMQRERRRKTEAARAKRARAATETQRQRRLTKLGRNITSAWSKLEEFVESSSYDEAVKLAIDLRDLAARGGGTDAFAKRLDAMRKRQPRRRGFFDRWKRASPSAEQS